MSKEKAEWGSQMARYTFIDERPTRSWTEGQIVQFIRALWGLDHHSYAEMADILNDLGFQTSRGKKWKDINVSYYGKNFQRFPKSPAILKALAERVNRMLEANKVTPTPTKTEQPVVETTVEPIFETEIEKNLRAVVPPPTATTKPNQPVTSIATSVTQVVKVFGDVFNNLKQATDEDLATAIQEIATAPMSEGLRKAVLLQAIRGIRTNT
jgi:hypothetical protein